MALSGIAQHTKGLDSRALTKNAIEGGQYLASQKDAVVTVSGKMDAVIDPSRVRLFEYGSPWMPTFIGCECI